MATPSTQRPAEPPRPRLGSTRSVRETINGRQHTVICLSDGDDADADAGADAQPPGPAPGHAASHHRTHAHAHVYRPSPAPSESGRAPAPVPTRLRPERPRDPHPHDSIWCGDLRPSDASAKRKRTCDATPVHTQNKAPRTTRQQAPPAGSCHAAAAPISALVPAPAPAPAPAVLPSMSAMPAVASPYPIPPVPGTSTWKSPAWQAANGIHPRPRAPHAAGSVRFWSPPRLCCCCSSCGCCGGCTDACCVCHQSSAAADAPPRPAKPLDDADGHYIVRPGENLTPRFKILAQLGQGTFGKVVEAFDRTERSRVAIKVIRAVQKYRDAAQIEIRVLKTLRENDPANEKRCIHLVSTFNYKNHVCIVTELLSKSVFDFLKENEFMPFPSTHIWSFAKQLLQSVAFLHSLQLIHTDLKPENILLEQADSVSKPYSSRGSDANAKRRKILKNTALRLIDFGSATFSDEYHSTIVSTRHYRAPEIILGMGWSFPCDAWSIGCILLELHTGDALFQTHNDLEHLAMMEACLGFMPEHFRDAADRAKPEFFKPGTGGRLNYPNQQTSRNSQRFVARTKRLKDTLTYPSAYQKHNYRFLHLVQRLLEWDPAQRISVHEALKHPYFDLGASAFPP